MKRKKLFINLSILIILLYSFLFMVNKVYAATYQTYTLDDYAYFDPTTERRCDERNYWTMYNQNTTCYRFVILSKNDTADKSTVKIMLDHDIAIGNFDSYSSLLQENTNNWIRYSGNIDIIDENTIEDIMRLSSRPTIANPSVNGGVPYSFFAIDALSIINGIGTNTHGIWSKTLYPDDNAYVYSIDEFGNNRVIPKTESVVRGIRPVLDIDKNLLTKGKMQIDISTILANNSTLYKYAPQSYNSMSYKSLQGFTTTPNNLVFYGMNTSDSAGGMIYSYKASNYSEGNVYYKAGTSHGNDMTYNDNSERILMVGPESYSKIYAYAYDESNNNWLKYNEFVTKNYNDTPENPVNIKYSGIGYDSVDKYYAVNNNYKIYILDGSFNQLYSFDAPRNKIAQGLEYHNGYIYYTTFTDSASNICPSSYQIYCFDADKSSTTFVFNAKLTSDKKPDKNFGRLVNRYYINGKFNGDYMELESISFQNNKAFFGFNDKNQSHADYPFKFYAIDYSNVDQSINYDSIVVTNSDDKKAIIKSNDEILNITGWNSSNDNHEISIVTTPNETINNQNVCDRYTNCKNISLSTPTINLNNMRYYDSGILKYPNDKTTISNFKSDIISTGAIRY